jgi:DNA-binding XRE family transcriptional regulator
MGITAILAYALGIIMYIVLPITLIVLVIRALLKYINSKDVRKEKAETRISLGDALREHRTGCKMTQEFVAETLGVSRQAVSKWENGTSDPTTSNLIALAKLYGVSAEELLKEVEKNGNQKSHVKGE